MALNLIFMGTPDFAVPILQSIKFSEHKILCVYTQTPKKKNRGQKKGLTPIHEFSKQNNLNVRHPEKLDTEEEIEFFKKEKPDVVVVVAYGKILPKRLLNIKNIQFINVHASLLPKWRGAAPIQRAIMNLDKETGISIMKIIPKLDAGPIMMKSKIKISENANYEIISKELSYLGAKMIKESLNLIEQNKTEFIKQDEKFASYAKKIEKSEYKKEPFSHIYIEDFFTEEDFRKITSSKEINLKESIDDEDLFNRLFDNHYRIVNFPGCVTNKSDYIKWHKNEESIDT